MDSVGGILEKVDLEPQMHMIADLSSEKFNLHLSHFIVELYEFPRFSTRRDANLLYTMEALLPMPPTAENTNGEKEPCSTSRTRSSYALFFSNSFFL